MRQLSASEVALGAAARAMTVGVTSVVAVLVSWPVSAMAAGSGEEPCRINADAVVIRQGPSKNAGRAGIGYRDQQCRFHGYTRDVVWAHITMKGSGVDGWVDRGLISTAKEELAPTGP